MTRKFLLIAGLCALVQSGCKFVMPPEAKVPAITNVNWVVPSAGIPKEVKLGASNNNVAITLFHDRLYMAFRSAPSHFASADTHMMMLSSADMGTTWRLEKDIAIGTDLREPNFIVMNDSLIFYYIELGNDPLAFTPHHVWRTTLPAGGAWASPAIVPGFDEVMVWQMKVRDGLAWMSAYKGNHYSTDKPSDVSVYFKVSVDGLNWSDIDPAHPVVYQGGVSEVGFEFDSAGNLWAVGRNEDGDDTGFGSHVFFAKAGALGQWEHSAKSYAFRYDSPRMFRQGEDLYLIARRNIVYVDPKEELYTDAPYDLGVNAGTVAQRRVAYLAAYSLLPKRTSIYKLDTQNRRVVWQKEMPSAADTAFASIVELDPKHFLVANYSNPLVNDPAQKVNTLRWPWIMGQLSGNYGTRIYLSTLEFP